MRKIRSFISTILLITLVNTGQIASAHEVEKNDLPDVTQEKILVEENEKPNVLEVEPNISEEKPSTSEAENDEKKLPDEIDEEPQEENTVDNENASAMSLEVPQQDVQMEDSPILMCRTHVQNEGWHSWKESNEIIGTTGKSRRMEALELKLVNSEGNSYEGLSIEYRVHVQNIGWQEWKSNGELAGTTGQFLRIEAIQIRLTGDRSTKYHIYYQTHLSNLGWFGWSKDGELAGSSGYFKKMEALRMVILKDGVNAPNTPNTDNQSFIRAYDDSEITYAGHIQNIGDVNAVKNGEMLGTVGQALRIEGITINLNQGGQDILSGQIEYATHIQDIGWTNYTSQGNYCGTKGEAKRVEAVKIRLRGDITSQYDIYYRTHVQNYGWLGWAKNGQEAGTSNCAYRMEALEVKLVPKEGNAPGENSNYYKDRPVQCKIASFSTVSTNNANGTYNMKRALASFNQLLVQPGETVSFFDVAGPCGAAQGYLQGGVVGGTGYGGGICQASTTLYGAVLRGGLTIVERRNHSVASTYVPRGLDAMVDYGSSDFKFRNDHAYPVRLVTYSEGNTLYAEFYGCQPRWYDSISIFSWNTGIRTSSASRTFYKDGVVIKYEQLPNSFYSR